MNRFAYGLLSETETTDASRACSGIEYQQDVSVSCRMWLWQQVRVTTDSDSEKNGQRCAGMDESKDKAALGRKDIDDVYARNISPSSYRERTFVGKKSAADEYTGERVYKPAGAKSHHRLRDMAETDHITPVAKVIDKYGEDVKSRRLSKEDVRTLTNADANVVVTSRRINNKKRAMSNAEYLFASAMQGEPESPITTYNMLVEQARSESSMYVSAEVLKGKNQLSGTLDKRTSEGKTANQFLQETVDKDAVRQIGNATADMVEAGTNALLVSSALNIVSVLRGKKKTKEAIKDTVRDGGAAVAGEAGNRALQKAGYAVISKAAPNLAAKFPKVPSYAAMFAMTSISVAKYLDGDLSEEEAAANIVATGLGLYVMQVAGTMVAGPAGTAAAMLVTSVLGEAISVCKQYYSSYKGEIRARERKLQELYRLADEAQQAMRAQREKLQMLFDEHQAEFAQRTETGIWQIIDASLENDANGIADGLNEILSLFHQQTMFASEEQFSDFFNHDENALHFRKKGR